MRRRRFLPGAETEFLRAVKWHAAQRDGLGDNFVSAVDETVERAVQAPETGSPHLYGTRRMLVERFRYDVIYVLRSDVVHVIAVAHQRRQPGYWRRRLKDV